MGTPWRGPNLPCFRFERELTSTESWSRGSLIRESSSRTEVVQVKKSMACQGNSHIQYFGLEYKEVRFLRPGNLALLKESRTS